MHAACHGTKRLPSTRGWVEAPSWSLGVLPVMHLPWPSPKALKEGVWRWRL